MAQGRSGADRDDDEAEDEEAIDPENEEDDKQYMNGAGGRMRRTKDTQGSRDHKCQFCSKTYLSYPALYTHLRNKHSKGADGSHVGGGQGGGQSGG